MSTWVLLSIWLTGPIDLSMLEPLNGITISCQRAGQVWASDAFAADLDRLQALGVNSVSIHPYGRVRQDGSVRMSRLFDQDPPPHVVRPIREAKRRGMRIMVKPHLAYWGSGWSWRGEIDFPDPQARARFWGEYRDWIVALARWSQDADIFVVGTELKLLLNDETQWRTLIDEVRSVTSAKLTYAANWDVYAHITWWDALDAIGIQAYFPLTQASDPSREELHAAWEPIMNQLQRFHHRWRRPILFTEFGYNTSLHAAAEPWRHEEHLVEDAMKLQARCLDVGLAVIGEQREWLVGAFLWKWFVGATRHENFLLNEPWMRQTIRQSWCTTPFEQPPMRTHRKLP